MRGGGLGQAAPRGNRTLFIWLVVGQVLAANPAAPVRGPKYSIKKGKKSILAQNEARALLDSIDDSNVVGLRVLVLDEGLVTLRRRIHTSVEQLAQF